jgi:hypothetical protein
MGTTFLENYLIARKDFQFYLAESFEISLKILSIKINKKVKNFPHFLRTEKADISDIT